MKTGYRAFAVSEAFLLANTWDGLLVLWKAWFMTIPLQLEGFLTGF